MSVSWSPAYNDGSYAYAWPPHQRFTAGPSNGYTTPPILTQVNAGSGYNQMVAEALRQYNLLQRTPPSSLVYVTAGQRQRVIDLLNAINGITAITTRSGGAFTNSMQPGTRARLIDVKQLRQNLDSFPEILQTLTPNANSRLLTRTDKPAIGTQYGTVITTYSLSPSLGVSSAASTTWTRTRAYLSFSIPAGDPPSFATLVCTATRQSLINSILNINLQPSADSPAVSADWATAVNGSPVGTIALAQSGIAQYFDLTSAQLATLIPGHDNSFSVYTDLDSESSFPYQYTYGTVVTTYPGGTVNIPLSSIIGGTFIPLLWSSVSGTADISAGWYEFNNQAFNLLAVNGNILTVNTPAVFGGNAGYGVSISQRQATQWNTTGWQLLLGY